MNPTERELEILKVLWDRGEATVRDVYEELRQRLPIVQNTVQAFLRTMEDKGLVSHRLEGRTFIYQPTYQRQQTTQRMAEQLLTRAFDGAMDQLVQSILSLRQPTKDELHRLEELLAEAKANKGKTSRKKESAP
ncbi:MAG: BlaI/MecI/CopY family transcriptional regulator [Pirellulaceae bacterium]|nr:BlaI/MecI/CopY family transcriptional regulator [Pirellulaceae bacterium]